MPGDIDVFLVDLRNFSLCLGLVQQSDTLFMLGIAPSRRRTTNPIMNTFSPPLEYV
jgi:hypothetical protein